MTLAKDPALAEDQKKAARARAAARFDDILKEDPRNPYAHFCRGLLIYDEGNIDHFERAREHFKTVTLIDDHDPVTPSTSGEVAR